MRDPARGVVLLVPGQGAQHTGMAAGLYGHDSVFTDTVDAVLRLFGNPDELRDAWFAARPAVSLDDVTRAQPLLFAVTYALGRMLFARGVRPVALLGHSVGELVAATLAGVFELPDAVHLMRDRVARIATLPPGGMLTVSAAEDELATVLARHPEVAVGAVNAPRQTVLAGMAGPLAAIATELRAQGRTALPVPALSAFHSPALAPAFADPGPLPGFRLAEPEIPLWSAFAVAELDGAALRELRLWSDQPVAPVLFWPTLEKVLAGGEHVLLDIGPGQVLATLARRHRAVRQGRSTVVALLPPNAREPAADRTAVADALAAVAGAVNPGTQ